MARVKDARKRERILSSAKALFAEHGFASTSIADIASTTGVPVGSIYTYFDNKDALLTSIVEEGWAEFLKQLHHLAKSRLGAAGKLKVIVDDFFPRLMKDLDLINILLTEGVGLTRLQEKLEQLSGTVGEMIAPLFEQSPTAPNMTKTEFQAALMVYFLGVLHATRVARTANLSVTDTDVMQFLRSSIGQALGIELT